MLNIDGSECVKNMSKRYISVASGSSTSKEADFMIWGNIATSIDHCEPARVE